MADKSGIVWTDATWNPITGGCKQLSPACEHCYAMRDIDTRMSKNPKTPQYHDVIERVNGKLQWTGKTHLLESVLCKPIEWKRSRLIFVESMTDLFADGIPFGWRKTVWAMMDQARQHRFLILTKRAKKMADEWEELMASCFSRLDHVIPMVTAENQKCWNERVPELLRIQAPCHGVSVEPMLGPIDPFCACGPEDGWEVDPLRGQLFTEGRNSPAPLSAKVDWIIAGGESGKLARPMDVGWVRKLVEARKKVPSLALLFKSWGESYPKGFRKVDGEVWDEYPEVLKVK